MLKIYFNDGTSEEFKTVNASQYSGKYRCIEFKKEGTSNVLVTVPLTSIKYFEDDHSSCRIRQLDDYENRRVKYHVSHSL